MFTCSIRIKTTTKNINTLCDNALFEAFLSRLETIGEELVRRVADNLGLVGSALPPAPGAPAPAKPSPTRNAADIAKSIFHRIFMAWTSIVSATICELKILQSRLPFSKGGGYARGSIRGRKS